MRDTPLTRRAGSWLVWWILMLAFWVVIDDSVNTDELLAGAGAAALARCRCRVPPRLRFSWTLAGQITRAEGV